MKNKRFTLPAAWLALLCAASVTYARQTPDFDQRTPDAREAVEAGRLDAGALPDVEGSKVASPAASSQPDVARYIVTFDESVKPSKARGLKSLSGAAVTRNLWLIHGVAVVAPKTKGLRLKRNIESMPGVKRVEEDFVQNWLKQARAEEMPSWWPWWLPWYGNPPKQTVPWGIARVNAAGAWSKTRGAGVKVAVLDTGVDPGHPDLKVVGGYNSAEPGKDFADDNGHGSHVSGIIAGQDNEIGVVGVAPDVSLYAVKVLDSQGGGTFESIIDGLQWCVANHIQIANMSLGGEMSTEAFAEAVRNATKAGVVIVAASGNSGGRVNFPAVYPEVIAVGASDSSDGVARFSCRGPEVGFIAPGVGIYSTFRNGRWTTLSGTSMACPHMTGLAALAVAAQGVSGTEQVREALQRAAVKLPGKPVEQQGAGMVDAGRLTGN